MFSFAFVFLPCITHVCFSLFENDFYFLTCSRNHYRSGTHPNAILGTIFSSLSTSKSRSSFVPTGRSPAGSSRGKTREAFRILVRRRGEHDRSAERRGVRCGTSITVPWGSGQYLLWSGTVLALSHIEVSFNSRKLHLRIFW